MGRVKKSGAKKGGPSRTKTRPAAKTIAARGGGRTKRRAVGRQGSNAKRPATTLASRAKGPAKPQPISYRIRELDAQQKCGPNTSVERLFRVDESGDVPRAHLVFLDRRHGWYCEHGVHCPAVAPARRIGESGAQHTGRTQNGGMRA